MGIVDAKPLRLWRYASMRASSSLRSSLVDAWLSAGRPPAAAGDVLRLRRRFLLAGSFRPRLAALSRPRRRPLALDFERRALLLMITLLR